jgi:Ca-activated chloride channel family protein
LADWAEPALPNLRLEVDRPDAQAAGRHTAPGSSAGWSAIDLGDLTAGRAVWVAGRVPRGQLPDVLFRMDASRDWEAVTTRLDLKKTINWHPALKALFGARRIRGLEFLIHSGYAGQDLRDQLQRLGYESAQVLAQSASAPAKVYAENARQEAHEALRTLLVREALDYGLACSETAFVAMRKESGKLIEGTVAVANALPTGWSSDFLGAGAMLKDVSQVMLMEMEPSAVMAAAPAPMTPAHHLFRAKDSLKQIVFRMMDSSAGDIEEEADTEHSRQPQSVLFSGVPAFVGGEAILFDSARDQGIARLPERATICRLIVRFPDSAPKPEDLDPDLMLLLFVDDLAAPRAKARLADLARQGCSRPLNLLKQAGQVVRLVLVDGVGAWASGAPRIEVALAWQQTA